MPAITAFPGGVSSFGVPVLPTMPGVSGNVVFLCNRSNSLAGYGSYEQPYTTLAAACASPKLRANSGDAIIVLPGHSESIATSTALASLVAGVTILGIGNGGATPSFRLTNTAAQLAIAVANTTLVNLRLRLEGAAGVVKAVNITAADTTFNFCDIEFASGASNLATIGIEVGAGANRTAFVDCRFRGVTGIPTDCIKVVSAVDVVEFINCRGAVSANATNGIVHFTAAATNVQMTAVKLHNSTAASTAAVLCDAVASTGFISESYFGCMNSAGTASAQGIVPGSATWRFAQVYGVDSTGNAILSPAAGT